MKLAMIGLGKMVANMVRRLANDKHEVSAYDVLHQAAIDLEKELDGVSAADDLKTLITSLPEPRVVWLMVPHQFVDQTIDELLTAGLSVGDVVIDGGNSNYKLSQQRGERLQQQGIHFGKHFDKIFK